MRNTTAKKAEQCRMFFVDGKKFKTNALLGFFRVPLRRENATKLALLAEVLQKGTEKYPSVTAVAAASEECYGALWQVQIIKKGGEAWLSFSMEVSKHVSEKEVLDFLLQLMKHPKRTEQQFPAETVERCKAILRRRLEAQEDDKISFAAKRARELAAEDEGAGICADGYLEDLEKLTAADISSFYEDLLAHAPVYLYVCGDSDGRQMLKKWKGELDLQGKDLWEFDQTSKNQTSCRKIAEKANMGQTRLVLAFDSGVHPWDRAFLSLRVLCEVLGGGNGLLFQEIREKQGLCYDISMTCDTMTGLAFVQTGVAGKDAKHTASEICRILQNVANDRIKNDDFQDAVEQIRRKISDISDSQWKIMDYVAEQEIIGTNLDSEQMLRRLEDVTVEDVVKAAQKLSLRTMYALTGEEEFSWD